MTTFATMKTNVASDLRDPSNVTFTASVVGDLINSALAEIGRIAPARFQEDITLVANSLSYILQTTIAGGAAVPEIEVTRVELWDTTTTPDTPVRLIAPGDAAYVNYSDAGWKVWDGVLQIPRWVAVYVSGSETNYKLRVWGYAPYKALTADADVVGLSNEREWALRAYCRVEALQQLNAKRELFSQWQTRSGNTDMSPAGLMNALSLAQADWGRRERKITVLREAP